tara:strand:+ start:2951 stop:3214 length:264 start_codon:yes stop_codon:yes gene_type:complete
MAKAQGKRRGGMKKYGRNKVWCENYRRSGRREFNKGERLMKHTARFPDDMVAEARLHVCDGKATLDHFKGQVKGIEKANRIRKATHA